MAWELAQKLRRGAVALPENAQPWRELLAIRYSTENGEVKLEKKSEIAKRLGCSPDLADATIYGDFVRDPLPMEVQPEEDTADRQDRAPRRMLDASGRPPKRVKAVEELERIFRNEAKVNARRQRFTDP